MASLMVRLRWWGLLMGYLMDDLKAQTLAMKMVQLLGYEKAMQKVQLLGQS